MNILLTGASGFIGSHLYCHLIGQGHRVRAAVRNPERFKSVNSNAEAVAVDFSCDQSIESWLPRLKGIDLVINAVGIIREDSNQRFDDLHHKTPCALFDACAQAGIKRVIQISALGADDSAASRYHLSKRAADLHLTKAELNWTVLRPSIVYGPGAKSTALFRAMAALPITPLVGNGEQLLQPIHVEDLIKAVSQCMERNGPSKVCIDLVGPEPISFLDLLVQQRRWLGLGKLRPMPIKYSIALRLGKLGGYMGHTPVTEESITMLARGNTGNIEDFIRMFNFTPRSMSSDLKRNPAQNADHWYASLFFFPWLLRWSIAFVWIITGLCSLGIYPEALSLEILADAGIEGPVAILSLYGGGTVDLILGLMMLNARWLKPALLAQISVMALYTLIISLTLPELWLHPFGPVTKNLPMVIATFCLLMMTRK